MRFLLADKLVQMIVEVLHSHFILVQKDALKARRSHAFLNSRKEFDVLIYSVGHGLLPSKNGIIVKDISLWSFIVRRDISAFFAGLSLSWAAYLYSRIS